MSTGTRIGLIIISLSLFLSFSTPLYAAEASILPTVTSMSGPTTGVVGGTYTFTSTSISETGHEIVWAIIRQVKSLTSETGSVAIANVTVSDAGDDCTSTACTISGTFTPTEVGTYAIYTILTAYTASPTVSSCYTHPVPPGSMNTCLNSAGKYITFVVTDVANQANEEEDIIEEKDKTLPSTGILSNQARSIYIGLVFICLGILITQTPAIMDILGLSIEKRKSKLENKYK